jgi:uncharacterized protein YjiS (DUF1127 family)
LSLQAKNQTADACSEYVVRCDRVRPYGEAIERRELPSGPREMDMTSAIGSANDFRIENDAERAKAGRARKYVGRFTRTLADWIRAAVRRHASGRRRRETIRWLQLFDERLLADIALKRRDIEFVPWRDCHRLSMPGPSAGLPETAGS